VAAKAADAKAFHDFLLACRAPSISGYATPNCNERGIRPELVANVENQYCGDWVHFGEVVHRRKTDTAVATPVVKHLTEREPVFGGAITLGA
jgi:hypothetical protein